MLVLTENLSLNEYWQKGIEYILCGQEEEAQAVWILPFFDSEWSIARGTSEAIDEEQLRQSLVEYLSDAVDQRIATKEIAEAYELVKHLCVVTPNNVNALLRFLDLSIRANEFSPDLLADENLVVAFTQALPEDIDLELVEIFVNNISRLLEKQDITNYINFIRLLATKVADIKRFISVLSAQVDLFGRNSTKYHIQSKILEVCLEHVPPDMRFEILYVLSEISIIGKKLIEAILYGERCNDEGLISGGEKLILGSHQLLAALMEAGEWKRIPAVAKQHQQNIQDFIAKNIDASSDSILTTFFLNYLDDNPRLSHSIRNSIAEMCSKQNTLKKTREGLNNHYEPMPKDGKIRIGYIGSTLFKHSVGWLSRWLFIHHNHSDFQIFIYHIGQLKDDSFNHKFFRDQADRAYYLYDDIEETADLIRKDEIDILIDLDSVGLTVTYNILSLKPAPIIATWLGWDASGCPEVDYFIADPYVLPTDADEYYRSKIWRLPQTYVAIDGFEVEVPTKHRADYNLPKDAIVYLCAQKSYKHHPDILRLQMQIIKEVPNSYLMVQLRANPESLMQIYQELALEVGISMEQLRFIHLDPDEMTHRANLQLADVVLDTFPYNGATTTLETLWMGVPLVTKVGQAFVARNSYAFMQNVGVTEGIAHTDAEYIEWGVRLGTDLVLRQQVMGKLLHSRKTSPLWNARSFTLEMENAYRQMWEIYQSQVLSQQK
jgi:predicted O-linked N-acetylglucosamine transferase (SPINDLY family)